MIEYESLRLSNLSFFEEFTQQFNEVLESGWYILGKKVEAFENQFASYNDASHCVGVASGLDALIMSIRACNFEKGSEILVPSNTYIATILAIIHNDLVPVLVEPDLDTYNITAAGIEQSITPKSAGIMLVHLYGKTCKMDEIMTLAQQHGLKVFEDTAQAHGAAFKGKKAGTFGDFGAFSFYPTKNLGALGDAGAILCEDQDAADVLRSMRNYGSKIKYRNDRIGYNSRLDELQAAFLMAKLKHLDEITEKKRQLAQIYQDKLSSDYIKPVVDENHYDVYHIYNIRHPERDRLKAYLLEKGIKTEIHYPIAPHRQEALKNIVDGSYPISELIHDTTLSLPISFGHSEDDIYKVVETMNKFQS